MHAHGKYIWFIDGDDWLLDNDAVIQAIELIEFYETPYVRFDYQYNQGFPAYGYYAMVWQYIFSREAIGDLRFSAIQPDEDKEFLNKFRQKTVRRRRHRLSYIITIMVEKDQICNNSSQKGILILKEGSEWHELQ